METISKYTHANFRLELLLSTREVLTHFDSLLHAGVDILPVRTTEHRTSAKQSEGVILSACVVKGDVP